MVKPVFDPFVEVGAFASVESARQTIQRLEELFVAGDGPSGYFLSVIFGGMIVKNAEVEKYLTQFRHLELQHAEAAFPLILRDAEAGDAYSMHLVAIYYQTGLPPAPRNTPLSEQWRQKAIRSGFHPGQ